MHIYNYIYIYICMYMNAMSVLLDASAFTDPVDCRRRSDWSSACPPRNEHNSAINNTDATTKLNHHNTATKHGDSNNDRSNNNHRARRLPETLSSTSGTISYNTYNTLR